MTRFDITTYPLINTQYTINLYSDSDVPAILDATVEVQRAMETDPKIGYFVSLSVGIAFVGLLYADTPAEPPAVFEPFFKLPGLLSSMVPTSNGTILSLAKAMAHPDTIRR